jgi:dTDP-N-acetylfucosamine:lipid II N-acetylfucosaminyltransferase
MTSQKPTRPVRHLHVLQNSFFVAPFLDFLKKHFPDEFAGSTFYVMGYKDRIKTDVPIEVVKSFGDFIKLYFKMRRYDRIFFHSFPAAHKRLLLMSLSPSLLKRMTWIVWGADLYNEYEYLSNSPKASHRSRLRLLRFVTSRFGAVATLLPSDFEYAKSIFGLRGEHKSVGYIPVSELPQVVERKRQPDEPLRILVGNSATRTSRYEDAFENLKAYRDQNIEIYVPLSYGDKEYAREIAKLGAEIFGAKFKPLLDWMAPADYGDLLNRIDVGVFNHKRQQALGNIYHMMAAGKKVYIRSDGAMWSFFDSVLKAEVGDACELGKISFEELAEPVDGRANHDKIDAHMGLPNLIRMWDRILLR